MTAAVITTIPDAVWYQPGSPRIGSLFGRWLRKGDNEYPSSLHLHDQCHDEYNDAILIDIFRHPETEQEYVIHPRTGTLHIPKYCGHCNHNRSKGSK